MKGNNKGVTLVELIVTIAIMGVIAVGIQGFTLTSAKLNSNVVSDVKLQYESQLVMANVQKHLINANKAVFVDDNKLLMVSDTDGPEDDIKLLLFEDNTLFYGEGSAREGSGLTINIYKLAEHITDFTVELIDTTDGENPPTKATQSNITLKMERNGEVYIGTQSVALRNNPKIANSWTVDCHIEA